MTKYKAFIGNDNYNETLTYFWIHMVRLYRQHYLLFMKSDNDDTNNNNNNNNNNNECKNNDNNTDPINYNNFIKYCLLKDTKKKLKCKILNDEWYKDFYSNDLINIKGKTEMVLPDKKQLPQMHLIQKK